MTKQFIPYGKQSISEEDISAVIEVLRSPWLTTGPLVQEFERALSEKIGSKYCVVFNSGTAALHAAYYAAGINQGDELITTPITFAATANAALYLGAKPVFVDIGKDSFHLDPDLVESRITPRTKAIVPVDMAGMPADLDKFIKVAKKHNLVVIEDACHALGASYRDKMVGSIADLTVFSFHPVKLITTGEGGAVTTDKKEYYQKLLTFRNHGIVRDPKLFVNSFDSDAVQKNWYYEQQALGYNYRLPDINCALGLSQLKRLDWFLKCRRAIAAQYKEAFRNNRLLQLPPEPYGSSSLETSAWHLYVLRLTEESMIRDKLLQKLNENGIGTQVHYIPVYRHPYYQNLGYQPELCPNAEDYYKRCFTIPLYPAMRDEDVERVIESMNIEIEFC